MESIFKICQKQLFLVVSPRICVVRMIKRKSMVREMLGKPPYLAKTLAQKIEGIQYYSPVLIFLLVLVLVLI